MKISIPITKVEERDITHLILSVIPRYWEDATVNGVEDELGELIPFRLDDVWQPFIDIDEGKVLQWPEGTTAQVHYKVCDDGCYILKDSEGNEVWRKEGYVPGIMPGNHYGDYIILNIDETGKITNWDLRLCDLKEFLEE